MAEEPPKPPYFLVFESPEAAEREGGEGDETGSAPLAIAVAGRSAIPLFSSATRARDFLSSTDFGAGFGPVHVSVERLVGTLEAHRDLVEYVAHDPPPAGEGGARVRVGKLSDLSDALRERARNEAGLFDIGGQGLK